MKQITSEAFYIAGAGTHHQRMELPEGFNLRLDREPNNAHDKNAISVWKAQRMLGYIPAALAALIAPMYDSNEFSINCLVVRCDEDISTVRLEITEDFNPREPKYVDVDI